MPHVWDLSQVRLKMALHCNQGCSRTRLWQPSLSLVGLYQATGGPRLGCFGAFRSDDMHCHRFISHAEATNYSFSSIKPWGMDPLERAA